MKKIVNVAAGVIVREDGAFLLGQRAPDTVYAGYWEFPGGKVEPGESPAAALVRELDEELGIRVRKLNPWLRREHVYEHAHVCLHFFEVEAWEGEIRDRVHSELSWQHADSLGVGPMLPANGPILKALRLPRRMGVTHAREVGIDRQLAQLEVALAAGLRFVQIREPGMPLREWEDFVRTVVERAHAAAALVVVNTADEAFVREVGADGMHLSAARLAQCRIRPDLAWVGASCHRRGELEHVAALGLDYAVLGAVKVTPTHPGGETLGWEGFAALAGGLSVPVFALGGLRHEDLAAARAAGAHGIAAIRGIWGE